MLDALRKAFNEGSDARLASEPIHDNPHLEEKMREYWRMGWLDVDRNWGVRRADA